MSSSVNLSLCVVDFGFCMVILSGLCRVRGFFLLPVTSHRMLWTAAGRCPPVAFVSIHPVVF